MISVYYILYIILYYYILGYVLVYIILYWIIYYICVVVWWKRDKGLTSETDVSVLDQDDDLSTLVFTEGNSNPPSLIVEVFTKAFVFLFLFKIGVWTLSKERHRNLGR